MAFKKEQWMRAVHSSLMAAAAALLLAMAPAQAQGTLRVAITASDVPTTTGVPTQGLEAWSYAGYPIFEPLVMWDLRVTDAPPPVIPWLATEWNVDPEDHTRWVFKLRDGVTFHDGSNFDADAVVWNLDRFYKEDAPQFEASTSASTKGRVPVLKSYEKIDDSTVAIYTTVPVTYFPEVMTSILFVSPTKWEEVGSWESFASQPAGTGAFTLAAVDRTSLTLSKNPTYWNTERAAKLDSVIIYPMAEATTRLAALRSGQVDWINVPPPDGIPNLRDAGFEVATSPMPHVWPYWLQTAEGSVFHDVKVRQAFNYALDREGIVALLNGAAEPAKGFWKPGDARYGTPENDYTYNPEKARELLGEAGFASDQLVPVKILISTSGSGQMVPLPMNELLQQSARAAGFELEFSVVDWGQMSAIRSNPDSPEMQDVVAINSSFTTADLTWFFFSFYPKNWPNFDHPETTAMMDEYRTNFDITADERTALMAKIHANLVDQAPWAWIVHDVNPKAFSQSVKGYTPAQAWYTDLTPVYIEP
jgi:peptide/nickel transport system substrate-binding protein